MIDYLDLMSFLELAIFKIKIECIELVSIHNYSNYIVFTIRVKDNVNGGYITDTLEYDKINDLDGLKGEFNKDLEKFLKGVEFLKGL